MAVVWVISNIDIELDSNFRKAIRLKFEREIKRGDLKNSVVEAIEDWNKKQTRIHGLMDCN